MISDDEMLIQAKEIINNEHMFNPVTSTMAVAFRLQTELKIPQWKALNIIRIIINEYG